MLETASSDSFFKLLQFVSTFMQIVFKWLIGLILRKLLGATVEQTQAGAISTLKPILDFVFLYDTTFKGVIGLTLMTNVMLHLSVSS